MEKDQLLKEIDERATKEHEELVRLRRQVQQQALAQAAPSMVNASQQIVSTSTIGSIEGYTRTTDWGQWLHRFNHFMVGNAIPQSRMKDVFLNLLGPEGDALVTSLCAPGLPGDQSCEQLVLLMNTHLQPKPSTITERYKFNMCEQSEGQTVSEYSANLKRLSTYCDYGINLNDVIRNIFVCGLKNKATKRKMLSEKKLTYERAVEIAVSDEMATRDTGEMEQQKTQSVNYMAKQQGSNKHTFNNNNDKKMYLLWKKR